ncbi:transketolase [Petrotoga sp. 9PWA.NaAc.5.4]|uniref:transketolase n=1 Tax=Petrotoga sp. 9PWA.NaAc.5.4 TaxID=1434328 RepID=UPI000CCAE506|nr:transketolase [Petrotoga sp. 9PWA.NaAc.5.4]PNR92827.1 transketolase [Petrotoga sp. 9PWA.NaAc.5.4]
MKRSINELKEITTLARGDILKMTTVADSGHPGGSMSSIDMYLSVLNRANVFPQDPFNPDRDRIVVSHGHTSPGFYVALARTGFLNIEDVIVGFRHVGSIFEGHVTRGIPGVEWSTGNLGQGLSAGVGMAIAAKLTKKDYKVYVFSSDGESAKGQIAEARRTARKENLNNLIVLIDYNDIQISGRARDILYVNIIGEYQAAGWNVIEIDGHDLEQINTALEVAENQKIGPTAIISKTIIGKGVSFMENTPTYHGKALSLEELDKALKELGLENDVEKYIEKRKQMSLQREKIIYPNIELDVEIGASRVYKKGEKVANRNAFGNAIADIATLNKNRFPVAAIDCDLKPSVKLEKFEKVNSEGYIQIGIEEHNAATIGGAMSVSGVLTFFSDFGVFGLDEVFNQQRLNDVNHTNLKTVVTHCGIDVGEDGKTHHEVNYIGIVRNFYHTKLIVPCDANQTDKAVRYAAKTPGNIIIAVGRSNLPIILNEEGEIFYDENYEFDYGEFDIFRKGDKLTIFTYGSFAHLAVEAADRLKEEGIKISVIGMATPLSFDITRVKDYVENKIVLTLEDHNVESGLANELSKEMIKNHIYPKYFEPMGLKDYAPSGTIKDLLKLYGFDSESLVKKIKGLIEEK